MKSPYLCNCTSTTIRSPFSHLLSVDAANWLRGLDLTSLDTSAVLVESRSINARKPEAPCTIDGSGARLQSRTLERQTAGLVDTPAYSLPVLSERLRAGYVANLALTYEMC